MDRAVVPNQQEVPRYFLEKVHDKAQHTGAFEGSLDHFEVQSGLRGERHDDREFVPVSVFDEDRGLAPGGPCAAHNGLQ